MLNRILLAALILALPLAASGLELPGQNATAASTAGWDPTTDAGVDGLPDRDATSARFLILSGPGNSTLEGSAGETFVALTFAPGPVRIAIFDPNTVDDWDQRVDGPPPNVRYTLYADPAGDALARVQDADNSNDPATVHETNAADDYNGDASSDSAWCDYFNDAASNHPGALTPSGEYRFLMRARMEPAPGRPALPFGARAGHKFAFNGTYLLPAGTIIGFAGGAVDERTVFAHEGLLAHHTFDPTSYLSPSDPKFIEDQPDESWFFNGIFDFRFLSTQACRGDIVMEEADADFQDPTTQGETVFDPLLDPTGVPPDNVPFYSVGTGPNPLRDVTDFIITSHDPSGPVIPVRWRVFPVTNQHTSPPDGDLTPANPTFSSEADTAANHASYDTNVQAGGSFQDATFDDQVILASPGLWCIRWESVDKANFIFMKFNIDLGTTPISPQVNGRVFCDSNGNGEVDDLEDGLQATLSLTRVDCDNGEVVATLDDIVTEADGTYVVEGLVAGACYRIDAVSPSPFPPLTNGQFPIEFTVPLAECFATVNIPVQCEQQICGWAFCNQDDNCTYDPAGGDLPLPSGSAATITLTELDANGDPVPGGTVRTLEVTGDNPRWCFEDVELGRYLITCASQTLTPSPGCPTEFDVTLTLDNAQSPEILEIACPFVCEQEACAVLFCDDNGNGTFDAGDRALEGVQVTATLGQDVRSDQTDANGRVCFNLTAGTWTLQVNPPYPNGATITQDTRTVTVTIGQDTPDTFFRFTCEDEACVRLYCDDNENGVFDGNDRPMPNIVVNATLGQLSRTDTTDINGRVCFELTPGTWTLTAVEPQGGWPESGEPISGTSTTVTVVAGQSPPEASIRFRCVDEACVRLFCDDNENGVFDGTDRAMPNIVVNATRGQDTETDTTDGNGRVCFDLTPGIWTLTAVEPQGGWPEGGEPINGTSTTVTVVAGQAPPEAAITFRCEDEACVRVFCDDNENGVFDGTDRPMSGIEVVASLDPFTKRDTTDVNGRVCFDLTPGTWTLTAIEPATGWPEGGEPINGTSTTVTVVAGQSPPEAAITFRCEDEACVRLFCDENGNGVFDAGDIPFEGIAVSATQGQTTHNGTTDSNGRYCFQLTPGAWTISATEPQAGWPNGGVPVNGTSRDITVVAGETTPDADIRFNCQEEACVRLFCDENGNGIFDAGDIPFEGIAVSATQGQTTHNGTTDSSGQYCVDLGAGDWVFEAVEPQGGWPRGGVPTNGTSRTVTVTPGEPTPEAAITFLCREQACVRLFCDDNNNGVFDGTDIPLIGITVTATLGGESFSETTNSSGEACFELSGGSWTLTAIEPQNGWPNGGVPVNGKTRTVTVVPGQPTAPAAITFLCEEDVAVRLFCDENDSGTFDGNDVPFANIEVRATQGGVTRTGTTDGDGLVLLPLTGGPWTITAIAPPGGWPNNGVPTAGLTRQVTVVPGENTPETAIIFVCPRTVCVRAFCDDNLSGSYENTDRPLAGVNVRLTMAQGILETSTGANGQANFPHVLPGEVTITLLPPFPAGTTPVETSKTITVVHGQDPACVDCAFECLGSIFGKVCVEEGNWDGVISPGETCRPVPEVKVTLEGVTPAGPVNREFVTGDNGQYNFDNLPAGTYTVSVDGEKIASLNLSPSTPQSVQTVLAPGGTAEIDFLNCDPGRIEGYVFEDPRRDCDGVFAPGEGLNGFVVNLIQNGAIVQSTTTITGPSGNDGYYAFEDLEPGDYTVMVVTPTPNDRALTLLSPESQTRTVEAGGSARADFGYATQGLVGRLWIESDCDGRGEGTYGAGDIPLPGILVQITGISGDANGYSDSQSTGVDGSYSFQEIPEGRYEVTIDDAHPTVVNLDLRGDATQSPLVPICDDGEADFWFCENCVPKTCACIRIFMEPRGFCDGEYTEGVDKWVEGAQVFIKRKDDNHGYIEWKYADADGRTCFDGLEEDVEYRLYLGGNQDAIGLPACPEVYCDFTPKCVRDDPSDCVECVVGFCEPCPHQLCCEGDVREVEVETELWCGHVDGDEEVCVKLHASLRQGDAVYDAVEMEFCNSFPGAKTGLNEHLTVQDVRLNPWGTATVLLLANANTLEHFGTGEWTFHVTLNDDTTEGTTRLRCEEISRGMWFTYTELCGPKPPCDREIYDLGEWAPCDPECRARYRVLNILSHDAWLDCEGGGDDGGTDDAGGDDGSDDGADDGSDDGADDGADDGSDDGCDPVGPKEVEVSFAVPCAFQEGMSMRHAEIKLILDDADGIADNVELLFEGDEWVGSKTSGQGHITLLRVWKVGENGDRCHWRAKAVVNRPCCKDDVDTNGDGRPDALRKGRLCCTVDWVFSDEDPVVHVCP